MNKAKSLMFLLCLATQASWAQPSIDDFESSADEHLLVDMGIENNFTIAVKDLRYGRDQKRVKVSHSLDHRDDMSEEGKRRWKRNNYCLIKRWSANGAYMKNTIPAQSSTDDYYRLTSEGSMNHMNFNNDGDTINNELSEYGKRRVVQFNFSRAESPYIRSIKCRSEKEMTFELAKFLLSENVDLNVENLTHKSVDRRNVVVDIYIPTTTHVWGNNCNEHGRAKNARKKLIRKLNKARATLDSRNPQLSVLDEDTDISILLATMTPPMQDIHGNSMGGEGYDCGRLENQSDLEDLEDRRARRWSTENIGVDGDDYHETGGQCRFRFVIKCEKETVRTYSAPQTSGTVKSAIKEESEELEREDTSRPVQDARIVPISIKQ